MVTDNRIVRALFGVLTVLILIFAVGCSSDTERQEQSRIVYGALTEPHSLHPLIGTDSASTEVQSLIYSALVRAGADKTIEGDLAESWTVSGGGRQYTFRLRDGIVWHDGMALTADDVVFTFSLARDPRAGYLDARELANIERVTADGRTVTFRLKRADSAFLARVSTVYILPRHVWGGAGDLRQAASRLQPIGTGPYRLIEWKRAQYLRFAANDKYYRGAPQVRTLFYKIVPDSSVLAMQLRRGEVDVCHLDYSAKALLARDTSVRVTEAAGQAYTFIAVNHRREPLDDVRVRQAMISAFQRQKVIDGLLAGGAYLAASDIAPHSAGYHDDLAATAYDIERADRLLTEAGYTKNKDGIRVKDGRPLAIRLLVSNKNKTLGDTALAFRQDMKAVGIVVEVVPMDFTTMRTKHLLAGDYDACLLSQRLPIDPLLRADVWTSGGAGNHMGYHSARIDALYDKARRADGAARDDILHDIRAELQRDMPQLFLWHPAVIFGVRGVEGIDAAQLGGKDNPFLNVHMWKKAR